MVGASLGSLADQFETTMVSARSPSKDDFPWTEGWVLLRIPGEDGEKNDEALAGLADELGRLPPEVAGVELERWEHSASGSRAMLVARAWRADRLLGIEGLPDGGARVDGPCVKYRASSISIDRAAWPDLVGRAERCERTGDWIAAEHHWGAVGDGHGPRAAYGRLRAALAYAHVRPGADSVRDRLVSALAASPCLPEVPLRLAGWLLHHGEIREAAAWAAMADAVPEPASGVPHLEGGAPWAVPAQMARWMVQVDGHRAAGCALMALRRSPPPLLIEELSRIAEAAGSARGGPADVP